MIHFGASSVTLLVGELHPDRSVNVLDYLEKPLPLARDIFRSGIVTRPVMEQAAAILRDFQQTLVEYAVPPASVRSFTTNILSEASNHEIFLNRMQITSGSQVELIDDGDMTRLIYQTTVRLLKSNPEIANANTLVSHIGPGNTRALYFQKGRILGYSSYRLGIFRTREAVAARGDRRGAAAAPHRGADPRRRGSSRHRLLGRQGRLPRRHRHRDPERGPAHGRSRGRAPASSR